MQAGSADHWHLPVQPLINESMMVHVAAQQIMSVAGSSNGCPSPVWEAGRSTGSRSSPTHVAGRRRTGTLLTAGRATQQPSCCVLDKSLCFSLGESDLQCGRYPGEAREDSVHDAEEITTSSESSCHGTGGHEEEDTFVNAVSSKPRSQFLYLCEQDVANLVAASVRHATAFSISPHADEKSEPTESEQALQGSSSLCCPLCKLSTKLSSPSVCLSSTEVATKSKKSAQMHSAFFPFKLRHKNCNKKV